jgi:uncharacterized membrane-anchored protein
LVVGISVPFIVVAVLTSLRMNRRRLEKKSE